MSVAEQILSDMLVQPLGVIQSLEQFINWTQAGQDRRDDFDMAVQEARESLGGPNCEGGTCQRS